MSATRCPYCTAGAEELEFLNGVLTCNRCGQQLQGLQEETEFQQGIDDVRGRRAAAGTSNARHQLSQAAQMAREEQAAAQQLKDAAMLYVRSLQQLLQAQGCALHKQFGVSPHVTQLLRELWLSLVPQTGILEPSPQHSIAPINTPAGTGGADIPLNRKQALQERIRERFVTLTSVKLVNAHNLQQLLWKLLHPQATLQLCFIACALLREAVTHQDIMTWALDGRLPFLQLPALVNQKIGPGADMSCLPIRCIQPRLTMNPAGFFKGCCHLAGRLGLRLPPLAGEAMLLRAVKELALPQVVYEAALQLYNTHLTNSHLMQYQAADSDKPGPLPPYIWLASALVIAIKLLYGLGGSVGQMPTVAKAASPPGGWQVWAQHVIEKLPGMSSLPLTEQEALSLEPQALRDYMSFCRHYVFAGQPVVKSLDDVQRLLTGWYEASLTAQWQGQQQQQQGLAAPTGQQPLAGSTLPTSDDQQQLPTEPQQAQQQADVQADGSAELSLYIITVWGGPKSAKSVRLEPSLKAVVVAVAAYYRVSHSALVQCVARLEKQMAAIESSLAHSHGAGNE